MIDDNSVSVIYLLGSLTFGKAVQSLQLYCISFTLVMST